MRLACCECDGLNIPPVNFQDLVIFKRAVLSKHYQLIVYKMNVWIIIRGDKSSHLVWPVGFTVYVVRFLCSMLNLRDKVSFIFSTTILKWHLAYRGRSITILGVAILHKVRTAEESVRHDKWVAFVIFLAHSFESGNSVSSSGTIRAANINY